jgi:hypothetical protein
MTKADDIFSSEVIKTILIYKWDLVRRYAYGMGLIVVLFAILLFMHTNFGRESLGFLYAIVGFGLVILSIEIC